MDFTYDINKYRNSDFNLSFLMDLGNNYWYSNGIKQRNDFLSKQLKQKLPENSFFNISSLVFNFQKREEEVLSSYSCFYQPLNESLFIILEQSANYFNFTKECLMKFMDFAEKTEIKMIYLLLCQSNKYYINLLMDLKTFGFERDTTMGNVVLKGKKYKVLKMDVNEITKEIEEVNFI